MENDYLDQFNKQEENSFHPLKKNKKPKGFRAFNLNQNLIEAIKKIGYKHPTPIQRRTIPEILSGVNVITHSRTGSGKTAAFLIPVLNRLKEHSKIVGTRCLILSPTRELAHQTLDFCRKIGKFTTLRYALLVGGNELDGQFEKLAQNPDIIIATPGRVMHHLDEGSLDLKMIEMLVIDEVDKIFELNFEQQIKIILKNCSPSKQVLLFSATIPQQLANFMKLGMREYKLIDIPDESKIPEKLKINLIYTRTEDKKYALVAMLKAKKIIDINNQLTLIFVSTKYHCEYLHEFLKFWDIKTSYIFGQMDQELRDNNLLKFRKRMINTLIVTDVAARGLDIPMLDNVINFEFPDTAKLFTHRIGRTARAEHEGRVFNLACPADLPYFFDVKVNLGKKLILNKENYSSHNASANANELKDCSVISFGTIPYVLIANVKETRVQYLNYKTDLESLEDSCRKATTKAFSFKQKPSRYGIKQSKKFINLESIQYHPLFANLIPRGKENDEIEKNKFLIQLKNFKPKESYIERVNEVNVKEEVIKDFKRKAEEYKKKKEIEKRKEKFLSFTDKFKEDFGDGEDLENDGKENKNNTLLGKKVKRSQLKNFKDNSQFVADTKETNSKALWGDEKPLSVDELTMNILPDGDNLQSVKKLVWDAKKKNFVRGKVDKAGKLIKKNEAGVIIKSKDKNPHPYLTWKKKNKLRVQNVGEMENDKIISGADTAFKDRKMNKRTKGSDAKGKGELKTFDQIFKEKKDKFKKSSRENFSKKDSKVRQINEKAHLNRRSFAMIKKVKRNKKR